MKNKLLILALFPIMLYGQANLTYVRSYDSTFSIVNQDVPFDTLWKFTSEYLYRYENNIRVDSIKSGGSTVSVTDSVHRYNTDSSIVDRTELGDTSAAIRSDLPTYGTEGQVPSVNSTGDGFVYNKTKIGSDTLYIGDLISIASESSGGGSKIDFGNGNYIEVSEFGDGLSLSGSSEATSIGLGDEYIYLDTTRIVGGLVSENIHINTLFPLDNTSIGLGDSITLGDSTLGLSDVTGGGTGGNPILTDVTASDTTRWGNTGTSGNPILSGVTVNDTTKWGTLDYINLIEDNFFQDGADYFNSVDVYGKTTGLDIVRDTFPNPLTNICGVTTGGVVTTSSNFFGIYQDIRGVAVVGDTIVFKALVYPTVTGTYLQRRIRDIDNVTLTTLDNINLTQNVWNEIEFEYILATNEVYINFYVRNFDQDDEIYITAWDLHRKPLLSKYKVNAPLLANELEVMYVDSASGNDLSSGSLSSPLLTINQAIVNLADKKDGKIIVSQGTYRETLDFSELTSQCKKITISAKIGERVRVLGSDTLSGWSKTATYTNVYEKVFTGTIIDHGTHLAKGIVFEDGNSSKAILSTERHPLQGGLGYRLPYSELIAEDFDTDLGTTLTALDGNTDGGHYHDVSGNKLYIVTADQSSPITNGYSYEYSTRVGNAIPVDGYLPDLELSRIEFYYSSYYGFTSENFGTVIRHSCKLFGSVADGFLDSENNLISYREETAGCGNDGQNGHYNDLTDWEDTDLRAGTNCAYYYNSWSHDNYDDATSHHERGEVYTYGGLFEYNYDRGIAASNSCIMECHNPYIRKNGQGDGIEAGVTGIGLSVVNSPTTGDGKLQTSIIAYGVVLDSNIIGAAVQSDADNFMILVNPVAHENSDYNFSADYGTIEVINGKSTQSSSNHKETLNSGVITVVTDADLN